MRQIGLVLLLLISVTKVKAQDYTFRENIDKDSLFNVSVKRFPVQKREELIRIYKEGNEQSKDFLILMISMPVSSKSELIANYESKKAQIQKLKDEYSKLIPENHIVDIEFEPESKIIKVSEQITIKIYRISDGSDKDENDDVPQRGDNLKVVSENWDLDPDSKELGEVLRSLRWTNQTLTEIRLLLKNANCVSVKNGEMATIGFARSGMGKYSYKIFDTILNTEQLKQYNNGCEYLFYKGNVVLEYGGGAVGPQCFERQ